MKHMVADGMGGPAFTIGYGNDIHRLRDGEGLSLAGLCIPCRYEAEAVSDGDVIIHALVDAILGACAMGDIGDHFPASVVRPGQASSLFLEHALAMANAAGATPVNVDCTVELEVLRLGPWKDRFRASLAGLLSLDKGRISVKAKTAEGLGPVGAGMAVAAHAVVLLQWREGQMLEGR